MTETQELRARLAELEETLRAIRAGEVDAVVVEGQAGEQVYTLQGADQPYRTLVEQMHEGAAILTARGDILYCNRRFAELVAAPLETVIGGSIDRFIDAGDSGSAHPLLQAGHGTYRGRLTAADGRLREVYMSWTTAGADRVSQRSLIVADLTELLDAQISRDRAERESRTKDEFMAMLAHELRNPLGAIEGAARVLETAGSSEAPAVRAREVIARQVRSLSRLVDELLEAGRVATGKISLTLAAVRFDELVTRSVSQSTSAAADRHIEVDAQPVWIEGDAVRLEQVVSNLVGNAVKYTAPGGYIRVGLTADGPDAVLRVEDDGVGIPAETLPRIFDLFVQGNATLDRSQGGLGIGLTLVQRLVDLHRGTVTASSRGSGRGSTFTVRLPRIAPPERTADIRAEPRAPRQRVLVIEDNQDAREMYRLVLELDGHEVLEAEDGASGLAVLKDERPDVALIDIGLPQLDGYELARRFRAEPSADGTVLVALTGYGSPDDREESRRAGFDYHLIKPVSPDSILQLLHEERTGNRRSHRLR
jgi:signal transduction histidine kinase/ActR/RegA family two-component response regulator